VAQLLPHRLRQLPPVAQPLQLQQLPVAQLLRQLPPQLPQMLAAQLLPASPQQPLQHPKHVTKTRSLFFLSLSSIIIMYLHTFEIISGSYASVRHKYREMH
jgi:hypothetical protein